MATKEELKEKFSTGKKPTGADFALLIDGVEGPQGPAGETGDIGSIGKDGGKGATGAAGKDGFGTQAEYDAIIARLEALESPGE